MASFLFADMVAIKASSTECAQQDLKAVAAVVPECDDQSDAAGNITAVIFKLSSDEARNNDMASSGKKCCRVRLITSLFLRIINDLKEYIFYYYVISYSQSGMYNFIIFSFTTFFSSQFHKTGIFHKSLSLADQCLFLSRLHLFKQLVMAISVSFILQLKQLNRLQC